MIGVQTAGKRKEERAVSGNEPCRKPMEGVNAGGRTMNTKELIGGWFLGNSYNEPVEVVYGGYDDDDKLVSLRVFELREKPYTETLVIWLNRRLLDDPEYTQKVMAAAMSQQPDILDKARQAGLTLSDVVVLYLTMCVEYGHIDQHTTKPVRISDWDTYAGQMMWIHAFGEVEELAVAAIRAVKGNECGDHQHEDS